MKINADSKYIQKIFAKTEEELLSYTDEKLTEIADNLALYKERMEKFGGNKAFRYGNYLGDDIASAAANFAVLEGHRPTEHGLSVVCTLTDMIADSSPWLSQGIIERHASDLITANIAASLAIVLENVGGRLGEERVNKVHQALYTKAFLPLYSEWVSPETRIHALDTMGHNWWCVCVSGAGLALYHARGIDPDYDEHMYQIKNALDEWFRYPGNVLQNKNPNWSENGDFIEYLPYMLYALKNITILDAFCYRDCGEHIMKDEYIKNTAEFILSFLYKDKDGIMRAFEFSDGFFEASMMLYDHCMLSFAQRFKNKALLDAIESNNKDEGCATDALFYPDTECFYPEYSDMHIYNHSGVASLTTGNMNFAAKTGESWNHNHKDAGTFVLVKNGTEIISDSRSCPYSYPEYLGYFVMPAAHNVILKDGRGINPEKSYFGTKYRGTFPSSINTKNFKYLLADSTAVYNDLYERFYRHFLFFGNQLLMIDDIFAHTDGSLQLLLHSKGNFSVNGEVISVDNQGEREEIYPLFPKDKKISLQKGYLRQTKHIIDRDPAIVEHDYISIDTKTEERRQKFITFFTDGAAPEIITEDGYEHVILPEEDGVWHIYVNNHADGRIMHQNAHLSCDNLKTDAFISMYFKNHEGSIEKFGLINGSYLKLCGETLYSSLLKVDILADGLSLYANVTSKTDAYFRAKRISLSPENKNYEIK